MTKPPNGAISQGELHMNIGNALTLRQRTNNRKVWKAVITGILYAWAPGTHSIRFRDVEDGHEWVGLWPASGPTICDDHGGTLATIIACQIRATEAPR